MNFYRPSKCLSRRDFIRGIAAASAGLSAGCNNQILTAKPRKQPNIILIMADDLGYECIGANGGTSYKTPVLDRRAAKGIRFEHCYSQPLCTPSRVQIMTGIYNVRNYVKFGLLDRNETTFGHMFQEAGYKTCVVGKWQLGNEADSAQHFGFDESCLWHHTKRSKSRYPNPSLDINGVRKDYQNGEYGPDIVGDYACDFIQQNKEEPFFIYYPMILTHCPFEPTPDSVDWDPNSKGSKTYKGNARYFGDMVTYMDKIVGKIIDKLDSLGLGDDTLLLFVGDNGTDVPVVSMMAGRRVPGAKSKTTDGGTRVPLIANWPGVIPAASQCLDMVDFSDFVPTLCNAAGLAVPETAVDGRSFWPQLQGKKGNPRSWIYCWYSRSGGTSKLKEFARNQRYKLYRTGQFYDIETDVLEKCDLAGSNLDERASNSHKMLKVALDRYLAARPKHLLPQKSKKNRNKAMK